MDDFEKCKQCKYYKEHYIISGTLFRLIGGHCVSKDVYNPRKRNYGKLIEDCAFWEPNTEIVEQRRNGIKDTIYLIEKHLHEIEQILLIDENLD